MHKDNLHTKLEELEQEFQNEGLDLNKELKTLKQSESDNPKAQTPWEKVQNSRAIDRLKPQELISLISPDFIELAGDKIMEDDRAIIGGIGTINEKTFTIIGTRKGKNVRENIEYNFGMPHPSGYRKALRLAKQAEKFKRPILFLVDTPGAFCGIKAEEFGISESIARNLYAFSDLKVPSITIITGEGGSGGALALSVSDRIIMLEDAIFSVISPEGCASILFKDATKAEKAAESLKITADEIKKLEIIDDIIMEKGKSPEKLVVSIKKYILSEFDKLESLDLNELLNTRYQKFRKIGNNIETEKQVDKLEPTYLLPKKNNKIKQYWKKFFG